MESAFLKYVFFHSRRYSMVKYLINRISILIIFILLAANLNAQNVVKRCKVCSSLLSECPHKGNHPKPETPQPRTESVSTPQKRQNSSIGKTRRLTTSAATDKAQAEAAQLNSIISTMQRVDLGLSVCWAGYNLGATKPEQWGGYYAWGETEPKVDFLHYKYVRNNSTYVNIGTNISGTKYDPARVTWGGDWRLPTESEAKELVERCHWQPTTYDGATGFKITGPNGNAIFMPFAGFYRVYGTGAVAKTEKWEDYGYYMTGKTYNATSGSSVSINMWSGKYYDVKSDYDREVGRSVRAVCK